MALEKKSGHPGDLNSKIEKEYARLLEEHKEVSRNSWRATSKLCLTGTALVGATAIAVDLLLMGGVGMMSGVMLTSTGFANFTFFSNQALVLKNRKDDLREKAEELVARQEDDDRNKNAGMLSAPMPLPPLLKLAGHFNAAPAAQSAPSLPQTSPKPKGM